MELIHKFKDGLFFLKKISVPSQDLLTCSWGTGEL